MKPAQTGQEPRERPPRRSAGKQVVDVLPNEEDRLRILLAHVVTVLELRLPGGIGGCSMCANAKRAAEAPATAGHRPRR